MVPIKDNGMQMPFGAHIEELRIRILKCVVALVVAFFAVWLFRESILGLIVRPHVVAAESYHINTGLNFSSYLEPIMAQLKACIISALIVVFPWVIFQIWGFVKPGLYAKERSAAVRIGVISVLCFLAGVAFGYFLFIPIALQFLLSLSTPMTRPVLMIGDYLSLFFIMTFALGIVFQTPLIMYQLVKWDIVSVESIQKHRRGAILVAFVLAAVLTPPDPMTQLMMAIPLIAFYDIGALLASPTRKAFLNFAKFAGMVFAVVTVAFLYYYHWPAGHINVSGGTLQLEGRQIDLGTTARVYRGQHCRIASDGLCCFLFGDVTEIMVSGPASIGVMGKGALSVEEGKMFVRNEKGRPVTIHTPIARVIVKPGKTELILLNSSMLKVTVLSGKSEVFHGGSTTTILPGRAKTFESGGAPLLNAAEIEEKWQ